MTHETNTTTGTKNGARPTVLPDFVGCYTVCSCVVVALLSASEASRLLMDGASWCRGRSSVPPNMQLEHLDFVPLILNSLILYPRVKGVKHIHTHFDLSEAAHPTTRITDNHWSSGSL